MNGGYMCSPCECGGHADCTICNPPTSSCEGCGAYPGDKHTAECPVHAELMRPKTVLEEAARLVDGDRQQAYGHPADNHACTAAMWNAYLARRGHPDLDGFDVCMLNILQKCSRLAHTRHRDGLVDIAGFARNAEMVDE